MIRQVLIGAALGLIVLAVAFHMTFALIGRQVYPLSAEWVDLRGKNLTGTRSIARLTGLKQALLSDNALTDAAPLQALTECGYIDLTGNPVSAESCAQLKAALPDCLILCEAADSTTTELALGGYVLPDADALSGVFASHTALKLVDLRGTGLTDETIASFRASFPHISFICSAGDTENTLIVNLDAPADAASALSRFPGAAHVTLTGCTFTPDEYRALSAQFPETTLDCMLSLYGQTLLPSATGIDLSQSETDEALEASLSLFPSLDTLTLGETLPADAARLKGALGLTEIVYSFGGNTVTSETADIDLRGEEELDDVQLRALLDALPAQAIVRMDTPDEAMLDVIRDRMTDFTFLYEVTAFGETYSSGDAVIDFDDDITDDDVEELMELLDQLPMLKEAHMYDSTLSTESMDLLFDSYEDVFFGWTFKMCKRKYLIRSDVTAFSTLLGAPLHEYTQDNFAPLRYCKNLQALDLGHNAITDLSFIENFPNLKFLIIADNQLEDISPLASLTELEYLEIFMNYDITDYSPLSGLPLRHLNIRCPAYDDYQLTADPFLGITTLNRFWASADNFSETEVERMRQALPDCHVCVTEDHSTGDDWRDEELYPAVKRMFNDRVYEPYP